MDASMIVGSLRHVAVVLAFAALGFGISIFIGPAAFVLGVILSAAGVLMRHQQSQHAQLLMMIGVGLAAGSGLYFVGGAIQAASSSGRVVYEHGSSG